MTRAEHLMRFCCAANGAQYEHAHTDNRTPEICSSRLEFCWLALASEIPMEQIIRQLGAFRTRAFVFQAQEIMERKIEERHEYLGRLNLMKSVFEITFCTRTEVEIDLEASNLESGVIVVRYLTPPPISNHNFKKEEFQNDRTS